MQVKRRLRINVFILMTTVAIITLVVSAAAYRVNRAIDASQIADQIISGVLERLLFREDYLRNNNERARLQWFAKHKQINALLESAKEKLKDPRDKITIDELIKINASTGKIHSDIVENREKTGNGARTAASQQIEERLITQLDIRLYTTVFYARRLRQESRESLYIALRMAGWGITGALFIVIVMASINTWSLGKIMVDRIKILRDGTSIIGNGNLDYTIAMKGDDEFVDLSGAFNAMTAKLRGSYSNLENEIGERKQSEEALRKSEERFRGLFETMTEGFVVHEIVKDQSGKPAEWRFIDVNPAFERMVGLKRNDVLGKLRSELFSVDNPELLEIYSNVAMRREPIHTVIFSPALNRHYEISAYPTDPSQFAVIFMDITDRKRAEEALRESEERFRLLFESMNELFVLYEAVYDKNGVPVDFRFLEVNSAWERRIKKSKAQVAGKLISQMSPTSDPQYTVAFKKTVQTGTPVHISNYGNISDRYYDIYIWSPAKGKVAVLSTDITERLQAEETVRESENRLKILNENLENIVVQRTKQVNDLSKALTVAEQRERKRFSTVLHENLQQVLLGAKMQLNLHLQDHRRQNATTEEDLEIADSVRLLEKGINIARSLSLELNPPILSNQGLDAALSWLCNHMKQTYGLKVELHNGKNTGKIRDETQIMLVQIVRELLHNVIKHSGVMEAKLETMCGDKAVRIVVADNGRGFNVDDELETTKKENKIGLFSVKERLRLFGGNLKIESAPQQGTKYTISLPYDKC